MRTFFICSSFTDTRMLSRSSSLRNDSASAVVGCCPLSKLGLGLPMVPPNTECSGEAAATPPPMAPIPSPALDTAAAECAGPSGDTLCSTAWRWWASMRAAAVTAASALPRAPALA